MFRLAAALAMAGSATTSSFAADRNLMNAWAVRDEIKLAPGVNPTAVKDYFPSFYDYLDTVLFHPTAGYYSAGRVDFAQHYRTFPGALSPSFGQMIAEQMFRMWDGMRKAGTLGPTEKFTIAEFGAGDGQMAESVLDYIDQQAMTNPDPRWTEFKRQTVYACYDRSPALSELQRQRNSRFGSRFDAREGDATNPGATIARGSLKGVILSNELPDCFSVHKVILDSVGSAEIAFTVPSIKKDTWARIQATLPASVRQLILKDDDAISEKLFGAKKNANRDRVYLSRTSFAAILGAFNSSNGYEANVNLLDFQELYVPTTVIPELAEHMRKYARAYAYALTKSRQGMVTYINLGEAKFIQGAGSALKAGYVITIDYGSNWDGILAQDFEHLRMYGPGSSQYHADPYHTPTLNDMTTDVNFSHLAAEGKSVGLQSLFFGPQHSLQIGTSISLDQPPPSRGQTSEDLQDYQQWAKLFYSWEVYKVLIQQKSDTDPAYKYPGTPAEELGVPESGLTANERKRLEDIARQLSR
ncbi:MAG: SAM-dependent methyltransferase [Acidobacteriota bacterium]